MVVVVTAPVEVECSAIVLDSNYSVELKVAFGRQGMIRKMKEMVIGLLIVCLYRFLLPRLCRHLGVVCALIIIIHTHIIL